MPVAITMRSGTWLTTLCRVRNVRKCRLKSPKRMTSTASTASMPRTSVRPVRRGLRRSSLRACPPGDQSSGNHVHETPISMASRASPP